MISALFGTLVWMGILMNTVHKDDFSHAIYVSVLEIEQGGNNTEGILRVKIFADDLEDAIFNHSQKRLSLLTNCGHNTAPISAYFNDHLQLKIDGNLLAYNYVSCEVNDISLWVTFTFASPAKWQEVALTADYLIELFPTQSNVVSVTYGDEKRMFRLTKGATTETVKFTQ